MDKKGKIIIFGSGYVGNRLRYYGEREGKYEIEIVKNRDLRDIAKHIGMDSWKYTKNILTEKFKSKNVIAFVNCVGYTGIRNVDDCVTHKEECFELNVNFPNKLYNFVRGFEIPFHHVSTGCIYTHNDYDQNMKPNPELRFSETSKPNFGAFESYSSFYSKCKHQFEMLHLDSDMYQWRIRMPYDDVYHRKNILVKLTQAYPFLTEDHNSVTNLETLYRCIVSAYENDYYYGIYNCVDDHFLTSELVGVFDRAADLTIKRNFVPYSEIVSRRLIVENRSNCILCNKKIRMLGISPKNILADTERIAKLWKSEGLIASA